MLTVIEATDENERGRSELHHAGASAIYMIFLAMSIYLVQTLTIPPLVRAVREGTLQEQWGELCDDAIPAAAWLCASFILSVQLVLLHSKQLLHPQSARVACLWAGILTFVTNLALLECESSTMFPHALVDSFGDSLLVSMWYLGQWALFSPQRRAAVRRWLLSVTLGVTSRRMLRHGVDMQPVIHIGLPDAFTAASPSRAHAHAHAHGADDAPEAAAAVAEGVHTPKAEAALLPRLQHQPLLITMALSAFVLGACFGGSNSIGQGIASDPIYQFGVVGLLAFAVVHMLGGRRASSFAAFTVLLLYSFFDMLYSLMRPWPDLIEDLERTYSSQHSVAIIWAAVGVTFGLQSHPTSYQKFLTLSIVETMSLITALGLLTRTGDTRVMTVLSACIDLPLCGTVYGTVWIQELIGEWTERGRARRRAFAAPQ